MQEKDIRLRMDQARDFDKEIQEEERQVMQKE